jgi:hypothetical protein
MRRAILWIVAILITFALGMGADSLRHYLFAKNEQLTIVKAEVTTPVVETPAPISETEPKANLILDYNQEKFSRYGALYIMGPAPEGFRDFDCIELSLGSGGHVDYSGYISVYSGRNLSDTAQANFALVTERYLYFTTAPSQYEGFQYRFEGEFLVKDFGPIEGKNKGAVRGTLTKSKNGRTLAEQTVTFRMDSFGC